MESLGPMLGQFLPLILIFGVFYFLLIRPQQKRVREQKEMLDSISKGDRIVTNGGIMGLVTKVVGEAELEVEIASGVKVHVMRSMVASTLSVGHKVVEATESKPVKKAAANVKKVPAKKAAPKKPATKTTAKKTTKTANKA